MAETTNDDVATRAAVTNLRTIVNNTDSTITIINGENTEQSFSISPHSQWNGSLWIPWVGRQSEGFKAIKIFSGPQSNVLTYLFQDYWNPPNANAIKYSNDPFQYGTASDVEGNNTGAGNKVLFINPDGAGIHLVLH